MPLEPVKAGELEGDEVVDTFDVPDGLDEVALTANGTLWLAGQDRIVPVDPATLGG